MQGATAHGRCSGIAHRPSGAYSEELALAMSGQKALLTNIGPKALIWKLRCRFSGVMRDKLISAQPGSLVCCLLRCLASLQSHDLLTRSERLVPGVYTVHHRTAALDACRELVLKV